MRFGEGEKAIERPMLRQFAHYSPTGGRLALPRGRPADGEAPMGHGRAQKPRAYQFLRAPPASQPAKGAAAEARDPHENLASRRRIASFAPSVAGSSTTSRNSPWRTCWRSVRPPHSVAPAGRIHRERAARCALRPGRHHLQYAQCRPCVSDGRLFASAGAWSCSAGTPHAFARGSQPPRRRRGGWRGRGDLAPVAGGRRAAGWRRVTMPAGHLLGSACRTPRRALMADRAASGPHRHRDPRLSAPLDLLQPAPTLRSLAALSPGGRGRGRGPRHAFADLRLLGRSTFRASRLRAPPVRGAGGLRRQWAAMVTLAGTLRRGRCWRRPRGPGCVCLFVGLDFFSARSLALANKAFNIVASYAEGVARLHAQGIAVQAGIVFGSTTTTKALRPHPRRGHAARARRRDGQPAHAAAAHAALRGA